MFWVLILRIGDDTVPVLSLVSFKNLNNDHYVPKLGFSTFGTISAVHFNHFSTHVTCITCVHVICDFCHISSHFQAPKTQCLKKRVNSDYLGIRRNLTW